MKNVVLLSVLLGYGLFTAERAQAIAEVRAHYGLAKGSPDAYNKGYFDFQDGPKLEEQKVLGADALIMLPAFPLGFGLRFEGMEEKRSQFGQKVQMDLARLAVLVNYRLIDTLFFAGPIASYGINHRLEFAIPTEPEKISSDSSSSYSIGIEGGVKLLLARIGAEVGYQSLKFKSLKELDGTPWDKNGLAIGEIDLSGVYYKLLVGVGF